MQKIDKTKVLSKNYKDWLESLGDEHPEYNSSNNKYYNDIKMSLLHSQKGLCAYTEELLCDEEFIKESNWNEEKYTKELSQSDKNEIKGDLEHFDESLKEKKAWLWDNLFIVEAHNNCRIKGKKEIKSILKPDTLTYDPDKYLSFSYDEGIFYPNSDLEKDEQEDIEYMIQTLGLNCIHTKRKKQLKDWLLTKECGFEPDIFQFQTAWRMTLENLDDE